MAEPERISADVPRGRIRSPQAFVGALLLLAFAGFALWAMRDLSQGTLRAMGAGMLPRSLAVMIGACGLALLVLGFIKQGEALERFNVRAPFFVALGILLFALLIRQVGLVVAGPAAMIVGGFGTPEARLRELILFAAVMTAFCVGLFRYVLNLPIPILILPGVVQI